MAILIGAVVGGVLGLLIGLVLRAENPFIYMGIGIAVGAGVAGGYLAVRGE